MKLVTLQRSFASDKVTMGALQILGVDHPPIFTLENPWKGNQRNVSCIPAGVYECVKHYGKKYHDVWRLENVENRSYILIHAGNTAKHTEGCILVGLAAGELNGDPAVLKSRPAVALLQEIFGDEPFTLEIKDR